MQTAWMSGWTRDQCGWRRSLPLIALTTLDPDPPSPTNSVGENRSALRMPMRRVLLLDQRTAEYPIKRSIARDLADLLMTHHACKCAAGAGLRPARRLLRHRSAAHTPRRGT